MLLESMQWLLNLVARESIEIVLIDISNVIHKAARNKAGAS